MTVRNDPVSLEDDVRLRIALALTAQRLLRAAIMCRDFRCASWNTSTAECFSTRPRRIENSKSETFIYEPVGFGDFTTCVLSWKKLTEGCMLDNVGMSGSFTFCRKKFLKFETARSLAT